jgi:hypothetical protein
MTATATAPLPRFRCEEYPQLSVRVLLGDARRYHVAQFREQVYDPAADQGLSAEERPLMAAALAREVARGKVPLYEDDGLVTYRCPLCDFVSASQKSVDAHRKAQHKG